MNYSYGYIYFESPENTRIFYNAYDIQERLGLGRKKFKFGLSCEKKLYDVWQQLDPFGMSLFDDNNDWLLIVLLKYSP